MLPKDPSERYLVLVLFALFLLGIWMLYQEIMTRQKKRRELYGETPARFLLTEKLRSIRERFQPSTKSEGSEKTKKAA